MSLKDFEKRIFLAPRSNESSYDNFQSTIRHGFKFDKIAQYLDERGKKVLSKETRLYAWGSGESQKSKWLQIKKGDYVLFYRKGNFVMVGEVIHKQFSESISDALWPRLEKYGNRAWPCTYFLNNLRQIDIPISLINKLAGYKENFVLQGFQALNTAGHEHILEKYADIDDFIDFYVIGKSAKEIIRINEIANKTEDQTTAEDLEQIDSLIEDDQDLERVIDELLARNTTVDLETINVVTKKLKRDYTAVQKLKALYNDECQICGFTIEKSNGGRYSEVAHIVALADGGMDNIRNMLVLCPNHHKLLDFGKLTVDISKNIASLNGKEFPITSLYNGGKE